MTRTAFVMTDIEGVAGVPSFEQCSCASGVYYDRSRRLLTREVNAAVGALLNCGYDDVIVCDGHGEGGLDFDLLHPEARLIHGGPATVHEKLAPLCDCDICLMIGQHAMADAARANQCHTQYYDGIASIELNGEPIGEIAQFALWAGAFGVPLVFLSGDTAACREAAALLPGIRTAEVKQGLSLNAELTLSSQLAQALIGKTVDEAVKRHDAQPSAPLRLDPPYTLDVRYKHAKFMQHRLAEPDIDRIDELTVRVQGDAIVDLIYRC